MFLWFCTLGHTPGRTWDDEIPFCCHCTMLSQLLSALWPHRQGRAVWLRINHRPDLLNLSKLLRHFHCLWPPNAYLLDLWKTPVSEHASTFSVLFGLFPEITLLFYSAFFFFKHEPKAKTVLGTHSYTSTLIHIFSTTCKKANLSIGRKSFRNVRDREMYKSSII